MIKKLPLLTLLLMLVAAAVFPQSASANRYLHAHDSRNLWLKDGSYNAPWEVLSNSSNGVIAVTGTATRISYTDNAGNFWLKDGSHRAPWLKLATNVWEGRVAGDKIYIVTNDFKLYGKQGDYRSAWKLLKTDTYTFKASPNRVVAISNYDGTVTDLSIKEGGLETPWVTLATPLSVNNSDYYEPAFTVSDVRVAYIPSDFARVYVKQGDYRSPWRTNIWGPYAFGVATSNNRLCVNVVIDTAVTNYCKDGPLESAWIRTRNSAFVTDITDTKIGAADFGSTSNVHVLEGSLSQNSGWKTIDNRGWLVFSK